MRPVVLTDLFAVAHGVTPRLGQCRQIAGGDSTGVFRPVGLDFVHIPLFRRKFLLQENRQIDFAHETDALRILALGRSQMLFVGDAPHLGLGQPAHRKECARKLLLRQLTEKIALILVSVHAGQQTVMLRAVGRRNRFLATVVPRRHEIGPQPERLFEKDVEFDFAVAQHVGIGRASPFVLGEHIIDHPPAVLFREIDHMKRDIEPLGHQFGEDAVVVPRAVAFERTRRIVPVDHEESHHFVTLLFEQVSGNGGIDASRKSYDNALHGLEILNRSATTTLRATSSADGVPRNRSAR